MKAPKVHVIKVFDLWPRVVANNVAVSGTH